MIKKLWKSKGVKVWFFVSVPVILLFAVIFIVASATPVIYNVFNMVMPGGGPRAIYQEGIEAIYTTEYTSKAEVHAAARDKNVELCEEGMVLLKNSEISAEEKALPLATPVSDPSVTARPKVSVFGKNSVNIAYGGSGSGGTDTTSGAFIDIYSALDQAGYDVNPTLKAFYEDTSASGPLREGNSSDLDSGDTVVLSTAETPQSSYTDTVKQSYDDYKDMALIVITRIGGEGFDLPRLMTRTDNDGNITDVTGARAGKDDHFLQLDQNESDMVKAVCDAGFDRVVICLNTGQAIETGFMEADTNYVQLKGYNIDPDAIDAAVWMGFPGESGTLALGVAGTLLLFYGLRVIIDRLARRGGAGRLRVFNFRQVEETVIHRSGALAICSLLILAALCCFGAGVATARSSRAETHTLDYTFPTDSKSADTVRETLTAHGLDSAFSDLFEMRIGRVRTSTDYQNTVKFPALQRTIDAMPVSDERQQLQYMLEAVGYPHLIALSGYNRLLAAAGLPELTLAPDEAAVYCDSEVSLASRTALINRLIAEDSAITIDGAPFTLVGQVQSVSVVTDRSITISFALIVPDAAFDHYTQGDYDVYLDGVLAPSMAEGKSLMNTIADMNALLDPLGLRYESYLQNLGRELFYIVAASYLTIYLAIIFLVVANTIIGVQFLMGQQKAARRYRTLVRLGAEHDTLCRAAKAQINWYFGLPVGVAAVSSLFGVRALFSGILSASAQSGMTEMMIAAGAMILLLCVVEWIYMAAVKRSSSKYLLTLMAPEREE